MVVSTNLKTSRNKIEHKDENIIEKAAIHTLATKKQRNDETIEKRYKSPFEKKQYNNFDNFDGKRFKSGNYYDTDHYKEYDVDKEHKEEQIVPSETETVRKIQALFRGKKARR